MLTERIIYRLPRTVKIRAPLLAARPMTCSRVVAYNSRANSSDALVLQMDQAETARRIELETRLRELEERFDRAMRAHGFDPAQAETTALPGALAELYAARAETQTELDELLADEEENE